MKKPIEVIVPLRFWPLARRIHAITLWPFVFYQERQWSKPLQAHEHYHWYQARRSGVLPWYILYVALAVLYRTGGRNHPMERRAYEAADIALREEQHVSG